MTKLYKTCTLQFRLMHQVDTCAFVHPCHEVCQHGMSSWRNHDDVRFLLPQAALSKAVKVPEPQKEKRLPAAKRRQIEARQDADDFAAEYRMLKKVKKGKMSEVLPFFA